MEIGGNLNGYIGRGVPQMVLEKYGRGLNAYTILCEY